MVDREEVESNAIGFLNMGWEAFYDLWE